MIRKLLQGAINKRHKDHKDKPFKLEVSDRCHKCDVDVDSLEALYMRGIDVLQKQPHFKKKMHGGTLKVFFVSDQEIRQLNNNYRKIDKPTDVISLSYFEDSPFPGEDMIGEIFISIDTAKKQAATHKLKVGEEALYLFVHGMLHVFGFDHEKTVDLEKMFDLQDKIIGHGKWRTIIE